MEEIKVETERFQNIIKMASMNGVIEQPVLQFTPEYLKVLNKDMSSAVMSYGIFKKEYFTNYPVTEKTEICIDAKILLKILTSLSGKDLTLNVDTEKNQVRLHTEVQKVKIPILESTTRIPKNPVFTEEKDRTIKITEDFMILEKIPVLKHEIKGLDEEVTVFSVIGKKLFVRQEADEGYESSYTLKDVNTEDFEIPLTTGFLTSMFNSFTSGEVELGMSEDKPFILVDKTPEYTVLLLLAPRV